MLSYLDSILRPTNKSTAAKAQDGFPNNNFLMCHNFDNNRLIFLKPNIKIESIQKPIFRKL